MSHEDDCDAYFYKKKNYFKGNASITSSWTFLRKYVKSRRF